MTTAATTIENHQSAATKGKILGCITYWSLRGFRVPRADFKDELAAMNLSAAYGRDMSPKAVLTRAVDGWLRGRKDLKVTRLKHGVALLHVSITNGMVATRHVWTVSPQANGALDWEHKDADGKVSGAITADMRQRLELCFQDVVDYASTSDLSAALTSAMQGTRKAPMLSACNLRGEAGGVYFVPAASLPTFEQLRDYITKNSNSDVARFWISDVNDNAAEVQANVQQSVEGELAELRASVLAFAKECEDKGKDVGLKTINARSKRYDDLRVKVDLWADMLGDVAKEMRAKIGEAASSLKADLGTSAPTGMKSTPPAPEAKPEPEPAPAPEPEQEKPAALELAEDVSEPEATGVLAQAQEMAKKITGAGFDARVHFAVMGASTIAMVQIKDHPVMGTGVMTMRDGCAPEFADGHPDLRALALDKLA